MTDTTVREFIDKGLLGNKSFRDQFFAYDKSPVKKRTWLVDFLTSESIVLEEDEIEAILKITKDKINTNLGRPLGSAFKTVEFTRAII